MQFEEQPAVWIFQANPDRYDIQSAVHDEAIGSEFHWLVNQHKSEIKKGDIGLIWLSGKQAGIYAVVEILSDPEMSTEPEAERRYWKHASDREGEQLRTTMKLTSDLFQCPLKKETILSNGLGELRVLKQPQGTNFRVTPSEWGKIQELIAG